MDNCWISFYLGICLGFSFLTVQSLPIAQFIFTSINNPANFYHPEPRRVWPENENGRGIVFFSFNRTRNKDCIVLPGNNYTLKYRMFVYDRIVSTEESVETWKSFTTSLELSINKI